MPMNDIQRRLSQVVTDLKAVNAKLADINGGWIDPPDPDKPGIRSSLDQVKIQAASAARLADEMLAKVL